MNNFTPQEIQIIMVLRDLNPFESVTIKVNDNKRGELLMIRTTVTKEVVEVQHP